MGTGIRSPDVQHKKNFGVVSTFGCECHADPNLSGIPAFRGHLGVSHNVANFDLDTKWANVVANISPTPEIIVRPSAYGTSAARNMAD